MSVRAMCRMWLTSDEPSRVVVPRAGACLMIVWGPMLPWPVALYVFALAGLMWTGPQLAERLPKEPGKRAQCYVAIVIALTVGIAMIDGFFRSKPLPQATVSLVSGRLTGPLIAVNDGVVYVGTNAQDHLYEGVPASKVTRLATQRRRRIEEPSIVQMLGWDFPRKRCLNPVQPC